MPQGSFEASSSRSGSAPPEIRPNLIALVSLTHTLCEAGRVQEAEELCRLILKEQPGLAIAQAALGRALYEAGKLDEAEICLERTVGQTPGCFAGHRWLAEVLVQKGAWDHAQTVLTQAAVLSPENPRVRQLLQTLPVPARGPTATEPGRPAHAEEIAAQIERAQPRRPRTTEYPAPNYEELPVVPLESMGSEDIEEFVTEPHVPRLASQPPPTPMMVQSRWQRLREDVQWWLVRQDWRAVGAAAAVGVGLAAAIGVGLWVISGPTPRPIPPPAPIAAAPAPITDKPVPLIGAEAAGARRGLENAIAAGDLSSLQAAIAQSAPHLGVAEVASARLFASALLAIEYGLPLPEDAGLLSRRLQELGTPGRVAGELAAARILIALIGGEANLGLPSGEAVAETPWLAFAVARARPRTGQPEGARAPSTTDLGPALVLEAESLLDAGELGRARALLVTLLDRVPGQSRARLALAEIRMASAMPGGAEEAAGLRSACTTDGPRSPAIDAGCKLIAAQEARRTGDRSQARTRVLQAAARVPGDPRLLARTAQLLLNLGETRRAQDLIARANALAGPSYPPLAWANAGLRLNLAEPAPTDRLTPPRGPDERLLAVRGALASAGAAGIGNTLRGMGPQQINGDADISWFAALSRVHQRRAAIRMAEFHRAPGARPPSPVGSYVLGLLARWGDRRHLAAYWLTRAREGHGDVCSASALHVAVESDLGRRSSPGAIPPECPRKSTRRR